MWLDALAVGILALFAVLGAARGGLVAGMGLLSLGAGWSAALLVAPRAGPPLARSLGLPEVLGLPLAGTLAFLLGYGLLAAITRALARSARRRTVRRSPRDRFLGGIFGAVRGALLALLLAWAALWGEALRAAGRPAPLPALGPSHAAALTEEVVEAGVEAALPEETPARHAVARAAARPHRTIAGMHAVLTHARFEELRDDALFWTYVEHGNVDAALNRASFVRLSGDAELRQQLAGLGIVAPEAASDRSAFRDAVAGVLHRIGPRLEGLRQDPALRELLDDPQLMATLRSGDTARMLRSRDFRRLVARMAATRSP